MEKDKHETVVVFRMEGKDSVVAVFPYLIADHKGNLTCYTQTEQHNAMSREYYRETKKATPMQYDKLLKELESIGYNLKVEKRVVWSKVTEAYRNLM